ncbi:MAG TPA: M20/M25/M40 family metallo-hydrolase [Planctomycetota bacterium]|nr:M20/M25/M40 family metallo-hydrolase [Planctomycetota bacterium]
MDPLLKELLTVPGAPGYESAVRALVGAHLPKGVAGHADAMGNLVATIGEGEPRTMFVAHMDEIGFVVSDVREDGFLKLKPLGGIDPRSLVGRLLRIVTGKGQLLGAVAVRPPHLMRDAAAEMKEVPPVTDVYVDIGARSRVEAQEMGVAILDFAVYEKDPRDLNGKLLCCRALDDRAGCWVLLKALAELAKKPPRGSVHFAFSVQEEVGLRGAALLARKHALDWAFAVDSCSTGDFPGLTPDQGPARLGEGSCLRVLDNATIIPPELWKEVAEVAKGEEIRLQVVFSGGGTDAKPFQAEGPRVVPIAFPLRYTHSAVELVHPGDLAETVKLVVALARHYAK